MVRALLVGPIVFILMLFAFSPKKSLYFYAERQLQNYSVVINEGKIEESFDALTIKRGDIFFAQNKIAHFAKSRLQVWLLKNSFEVEGIRFEGMAKDMVPTKLTKVLITHYLTDPTRLNLKLYGEFGEAEGYYEIKSKKLRIDLKKKGNIGPIESMLKKDKGGYYYEITL